jgi:hypothetical protein
MNWKEAVVDLIVVIIGVIIALYIVRMLRL